MKHVIVTGASRGLGEVLVTGLLADGYRISCCSRTKSDFIGRMSTHAGYKNRFFWKASAVNDAEQVTAFVNAAVEQARATGVYALINNAGVAGEGILATFPTKDADRIIQTNLLGAIYATRAVLRHLLRSQNGGRIINISSIIGTRGYTGLAAYSASKAGMDGLSRAVAREVGRRGITCNSIAPGYLTTEMSSTLGAAQKAQIINRTPLGRLGTCEDVLGVARFLLSDAAGFMTGQTILVDGGISC
jgi:3-oxoacyl-[acyl-carrier protein] reductase